MTKAVLSFHVLAAILCIGPLAVATSLFPAALRRASTGGSLASARLLDRVSRASAIAGIAVPVFGLTTAGRMDALGSPWLIASIILVLAAAALLLAVVLPQQSRLLAAVVGGETDSHGRTTRRLAGVVGLFNLIWAIVVVLMIVRPGSTTGA